MTDNKYLKSYFKMENRVELNIYCVFFCSNFKMEQQTGVVVSRVYEFSSSQDHLKKNDIILSIDGRSQSFPPQFVNACFATDLLHATELFIFEDAKGLVFNSYVMNCKNAYFAAFDYLVSQKYAGEICVVSLGLFDSSIVMSQ